jgi:hypothetical protein
VGTFVPENPWSSREEGEAMEPFSATPCGALIAQAYGVLGKLRDTGMQALLLTRPVDAASLSNAVVRARDLLAAIDHAIPADLAVAPGDAARLGELMRGIEQVADRLPAATLPSTESPPDLEQQVLRAALAASAPRLEATICATRSGNTC